MVVSYSDDLWLTLLAVPAQATSPSTGTFIWLLVIVITLANVPAVPAKDSSYKFTNFSIYLQESYLKVLSIETDSDESINNYNVVFKQLGAKISS